MYQPGDFDIAIVGLAGKFPGADSVDKYWQNLVQGRESIRFFEDEELARAGVPRDVYQRPGYVKAAPVINGPGLFDARFFNYSQREAEVMDPQHRLFLQCCYHALENAGHTADGFDGRVGVYAGSAMNTYFLFANLAHHFTTDYLPTLLASDKDFLSTRVSYQLNLTGPSLTIQTACSTSLVAIHTACQSLLNEECDMALAGGVAIRVPHIAGHQAEEGSVFSPDGHCRPFDASAAGTIFGSGAGVVVLKRAADAVADGDTITAVIKGSAVNNDGNRKSGYTAPGVEMQSRAVIESHAAAGIDAATISYIEAHGTGTYLGDPIEIAALTAAFRTQTDRRGFCRIGSVKSNIGHLDAAAGVAGLIKTALALKHRLLPPVLHFEKPNPQIDFDASPFIVNNQLTRWESSGIRRAAVNSLGIGGTNAHIVLEEGPQVTAPQQQPGERQQPQLLVLSARTESALDAAADNIVSALSDGDAPHLADAAFTLQAGRNRLEHRRWAVVARREDAARLHKPSRRVNRLNDPGVVFMFPGQGAQYAGMSRGLYESQPVFAQHIDSFHHQLQAENNIDLKGVLFPAAGQQQAATALLQQTQITQPALFAVEYALAQLWISWGIQPVGVVGHSVGEFASACIAGVLQPADAMRLVALRGALISALPAGKMLAVALPGSAVQQQLGPRLELAAANSPAASVVAGPAEMVEEFEAELQGQGVACQVLRTSHAFHSAMMTPILDEFLSAVDAVQLRPAQIPVFSTVTGAAADAELYTGPQFWIDNIRKPVRFAEAAAAILKQPDRVLLETGPGQTLSGFIREQPGHNQRHAVCTSLRHPKDNSCDTEFLLRTLGAMWEAGVTVDWQRIHATQRQRVPLPGYAFDNQNYWLATAALPGAGTATAGGTDQPIETASQAPRKPVAEWLYQPVWRPLPVQHDVATTPGGVWLLFGGEKPLQHAVEALGVSPGNIISVQSGARFKQSGPNSYTINPHSAEDYINLFSTLQGSDTLPSHLVHAWMTGAAAGDEKELQHGLHSLTFIAAALGKVCPLHELDFVTITQGALAAAKDDCLTPARAAAVAACKLIPLEHPSLRCRHIDFASDTNKSPSSGSLRDALRQYAAIREPSVAVRGNQLLCQNFVACRGGTAEPEQPLRSGDTYVVFGGLGGIGLAIAREIASKVDVNLVLVSRHPLPADDSSGSPLSKKHALLKDLQRSGSRVLVLQGDVSQRDSITKVVQQVNQHFGPINGVIHAAGAPGPTQSIQQISQADTAACMPAKLTGPALIEELLAAQPLRFFIGFSTLGATLYHHRIGELSYLAANMALDAFPHKRRSGGNVFRQIIQWDEWSGAGMAADIAARQVSPEAPLFDADDVITPAEGARVFSAAIATRQPQVLVSVHDLNQRITRETAHAAPPLPAKITAAAGADNDTIASLTQIWSGLLGASGIQPDDDFFELGGSSLLAVRMNSLINSQLGKKLPLGSILEMRTIRRLAQLLDDGAKKLHPSLVAIQPNGSKPPLFLMHAAGGNIMFYRQLASHLDGDQPLYGLQSQALSGGAADFCTIEEMASQYVQAILEVQPDGPYLVGGYCMGGTISLEAAQQLRRLGKEVALVAMFETYNWARCKRPHPMSGTRFWLEKIYFAMRNTLAAGSGLSTFVREKLSVVSDRRKVWRGEIQRKVQAAASDQQLLAQVWENNDRAAMQYRPQPYSNQVTLFRPGQRHSVFHGCEFENIDAHVETIPCFPAAMMLEPFAATLATRLTSAIATATGNLTTALQPDAGFDVVQSGVRFHQSVLTSE